MNNSNKIEQDWFFRFNDQPNNTLKRKVETDDKQEPAKKRLKINDQVLRSLGYMEIEGGEIYDEAVINSNENLYVKMDFNIPHLSYSNPPVTAMYIMNLPQHKHINFFPSPTANSETKSNVKDNFRAIVKSNLQVYTGTPLVISPKLIDLQSNTFASASYFFYDHQYAKAEKIAKAALEMAMPQDRYQLNLLLAKSCFMQGEIEKRVDGDNALEEGLKEVPSSEYKKKKCEFLRDLCIICFSESNYHLAEILATSGIRVRYSDFIKGDLHLCLSWALFFQEKYLDAKKNTQLGLKLPFLDTTHKEYLINLRSAVS